MNCWPSGKYVHLLYMYSILGRGSFCFNYCLNSAWHGGAQFVHCWGGMEVQVSLAFRSGEFAGQSSTPTSWSFNQLLAVWAGAKSCCKNEISIFKKLISRRMHDVLQNFLVNGCSDVGFQKTQWTNTSRWHCAPNHHRLWKLNTGLQATLAMSLSTLLPDYRTLVSKWNTKLALIWGLWTTGQQSSSSSP